jgi:hypothetical protein
MARKMLVHSSRAIDQVFRPLEPDDDDGQASAEPRRSLAARQSFEHLDCPALSIQIYICLDVATPQTE